MDEKDFTNYDNCANTHSTIIGNSMDFEINPCMPDSEVRADMTVGQRKSIRVWGQIKDCQGKPVPKALLKLIRIINVCGKEKFVGIAHTVCDCKGFYQFDVCVNENGNYKLLVGKTDYGTEIILPESRQCCDACDDDFCSDNNGGDVSSIFQCKNPCDD